MKAIKLAWLEILRFRGPVRRFVPLVIVLVPLLYGALYLWSNWDPYGQTRRIPVAVVNSDKAVTTGGERVDAGRQFVEQLRATRTFDWHFVDREEAREGLVEGRYYFTVTVPADFSTKLASATHSPPQRASIRITKNDAHGYLVGIMADTARHKLQNQVNATAHTAYARALYGELGRAREDLRAASEATHQLVEGTELSKQSTKGLSQGLNGMRERSGLLAQGVQNVSDATAQLDGQLSAITGFAAQELPGAANSLVNTSDVAVTSLSSIATSTEFTRDRAAESAATTAELGKRHPELLNDPVYQRAVDHSRRLSAATGTSAGEAQRALRTAQDAGRQARSLQDHVGTMQQRVQSIDTPLDTLRAGASKLAGGAQGVTGGLGTLASGTDVLRANAGQLNDGARRLSDLVNDSMDRIPPTNPTEVSDAAEVLGSPTELRSSNLNPAHVYGRGLAPLFFAIALWVFGLVAYLVLAPVNERALGGRINAASIAIGGFLPAAALGIIGGLVLFGVVDLALGLRPEHLWWTVGLLSLAAAVFVAIDHFLRTAFGAVGGLVSLVLLIVQITASGGLYPIETSPVAFQAVHPFLPMTYVVEGLRVTISGGVPEHLLHDAAVLGGILLASLITTTLVVQSQRTWSLRRLHPQVAL